MLKTDGLGFFEEVMWDKPNITDDEIEVRSIFTGICRSDIDMMNGKFSLPLHMQGHEGVGEVIAVGSNVLNVKVGDYVATRGEPAYADIYNVKQKQYVRIPEASPKYIIEPVACALNILGSTTQDTKRLALVGSGFLATIIYQSLDRDIEEVQVFGNSNHAWWSARGVELQTVPTGKYGIIIDLSDLDWPIVGDHLAVGGHLVIGASKSKPIPMDFNAWSWNDTFVTCPSPRNSWFHHHMSQAVLMINSGLLNVDHVWTRGYDRNTEWQQAFSDATNRTPGYSRGYLKW